MSSAGQFCPFCGQYLHGPPERVSNQERNVTGCGSATPKEKAGSRPACLWMIGRLRGRSQVPDQAFVTLPYTFHDRVDDLVLGEVLPINRDIDRLVVDDLLAGQ
jgi:hypothetical protein